MSDVTIPSKRATETDERQRDLVNSLRSSLPGGELMSDAELLDMAGHFKANRYFR
jgi:hypothetical protein